MTAAPPDVKKRRRRGHSKSLRGESSDAWCTDELNARDVSKMSGRLPPAAAWAIARTRAPITLPFSSSICWFLAVVRNIENLERTLLEEVVLKNTDGKQFFGA